MVGAKEQQCRFFLLRYVPDAVKNEFVNVGVVLTPASGSPELRLTRTWSRVLGLDPQADVEMLQAFWNELSQNAEQGLALKKIEDSFSNCLQASEQKVCLTDSPAREADETVGSELFEFNASFVVISLGHIFHEKVDGPYLLARSCNFGKSVEQPVA